MKVVGDEVKNVRKINVQFEPNEIKQILILRATEQLGLPYDMQAAVGLHVDLSDNSMSYVRGEVPLSREQLLESLGLTPTEPVETDGAEIAEHLSDEEPAVEMTPVEQASERVQGLLKMLQTFPQNVGALRKQAESLARVDPYSMTAARLMRVVEALEGELGSPGVPLTADVRAPEPAADVTPLVPRLPTADSITQARRRLTVLAECLKPSAPFVDNQVVRKDVLYVLALLGGDL